MLYRYNVNRMIAELMDSKGKAFAVTLERRRFWEYKMFVATNSRIVTDEEFQSRDCSEVIINANKELGT